VQAWAVDFITEDKFPTAVYRCPCCRTITYFDLNGNGAVPVARCCGSAQPFPLEHYAHLKLKPVMRPVPTQAVTNFAADLFERSLMRRLWTLIG
jgi:hypothetical protein